MTLHVVSMSQWRADDLQGELCLALDGPPLLSSSDLIWSPGWWVAVGQALGYERYQSLSSVRGWHEALSPEFLGRGIHQTTAISLSNRYQPITKFVKLEDMKADHQFPASVQSDGGCKFAQELLSNNAHPNTRLLVSDAVVGGFSAEHRVLVIDGQAVDSFQYTPGQWDGSPSPEEFVQRAIDHSDREFWPRSFVLDVGIARHSEKPLIVEANPIWCSGWTGGMADPMTSQVPQLQNSLMREALSHEFISGSAGPWIPDPWQQQGADSWVCKTLRESINKEYHLNQNRW